MDRARTVVVSGVPARVLPTGRTADKLTIHFQSRRRSHGGDVTAVAFPTSVAGVAFVTFDRPEDAARVVRKDRQVMMDAAFPEDYRLTVFPFSDDVFFYVSSARVDLSFLVGDEPSLLEGLRSAHRSLRFRPLPRTRAAAVEGPFAAVRALGADLLRRAGATEDATEPTAPNDDATVMAASGEDAAKNGNKSICRRVVGQESSDPGLLTAMSGLNLPAKYDGTLRKGLVPAEGRLTMDSGGNAAKRDVWLDLHAYRYVEKFHKRDLDRCLTGVAAKTLKDSDWGSDSAAAAGGKSPDVAAAKLRDLMHRRQSTPCVFEPDRSSSSKPVLCVVKDSRIKTIGPAASGRQLSKKMKDRLEKASQ